MNVVDLVSPSLPALLRTIDGGTRRDAVAMGAWMGVAAVGYWYQGLFLAALSRLHGRFGQDPATVFDWIAVGWQRLRTDLDVQTILNLALTATQIPLSGVRNLVVPARSGVVGPADVVFISASASSIYTDLRKDGLIGS